MGGWCRALGASSEASKGPSHRRGAWPRPHRRCQHHVNPAEAKLLTLPTLREVPINGRSLILRGGTVEPSQAICLRDTSNERCTFNYINQAPDRPAIDQVSITQVTLSGEWFVIGFNQSETGLGNELAPQRQCSADAAGTVIEVLADSRVDVNGREYFTAAVPPTDNYVRPCYLDIDTLVAASSGMLTRPADDEKSP